MQICRIDQVEVYEKIKLFNEGINNKGQEERSPRLEDLDEDCKRERSIIYHNRSRNTRTK